MSREQGGRSGCVLRPRRARPRGRAHRGEVVRRTVGDEDPARFSHACVTVRETKHEHGRETRSKSAKSGEIARMVGPMRRCSPSALAAASASAEILNPTFRSNPPAYRLHVSGPRPARDLAISSPRQFFFVPLRVERRLTRIPIGSTFRRRLHRGAPPRLPTPRHSGRSGSGRRPDPALDHRNRTVQRDRPVRRHLPRPRHLLIRAPDRATPRPQPARRPRRGGLKPRIPQQRRRAASNSRMTAPPPAASPGPRQPLGPLPARAPGDPGWTSRWKHGAASPFSGHNARRPSHAILEAMSALKSSWPGSWKGREEDLYACA